MAWGFLLAWFEIIFIFGLGESANIPKVVSIFSTLVAIVNIIANFSLIADHDLMQNTATLIDIMTVGLGCFSILSVNNPEAKKRAMLTYTALSLCLFLTLFVTFSFVLVIEEITEENN